MPSIIENIVKKSTSLNDETIATSMLAANDAAAKAYLSAAMTTPTPELRAIYSSSLSQIISGHSALMELVIKRNWGQPYNSPTQQLSDAYTKASQVVDARD